MTRLVVQTNIAHERHLWLINDSGRILRTFRATIQHHGADRLLAAIERLLGGRWPSAIVVVRGPGPFTAIRAALVITNMLSNLKKIPLIGVVKKSVLTATDLRRLGQLPLPRLGQSIRPWYGRPPNITRVSSRPYLATTSR